VLVIRLPRISAAALLIGPWIFRSGAARVPGFVPQTLWFPRTYWGVSGRRRIRRLARYSYLPGANGRAGPGGSAAGCLLCCRPTAVALRFGRAGETALILILSGIIIGALFSAFISAIKFVADPDNTLPAITYWLMGSLSSVDAVDVYAAAGPILAGFILLMSLRWNLNIMGVWRGGRRAPLGVNTRPGPLRHYICGDPDDRRPQLQSAAWSVWSGSSSRTLRGPMWGPISARSFPDRRCSAPCSSCSWITWRDRCSAFGTPLGGC